jgi:hypothetical protein
LPAAVVIGFLLAASLAGNGRAASGLFRAAGILLVGTIVVVNNNLSLRAAVR